MTFIQVTPGIPGGTPTCDSYGRTDGRTYGETTYLQKNLTLVNARGRRKGGSNVGDGSQMSAMWCRLWRGVHKSINRRNVSALRAAFGAHQRIKGGDIEMTHQGRPLLYAVDSKTAPAGNRGLTRSLEPSKEGLAMNATSAPGPKWSKLTWLKSLRGVDLTDSEYRVLTMLATYTGRDGRNAFPGNARLASDCLMQPRSVRRIIARLEAKGHIVLTNHGGNRYGKGRANVYGIVPRLEVASGAKGDRPSTQGGPINTASLTGESSHQGMHQAIDHSEDKSSGSTPVLSLNEWDDMIDDFDALEEWLEDGTVDYDAVAASTALGMWEDGRHPLAIRNTLRKRDGSAA